MKRAEILEAARVCVCGEREQDYGTPEDSFGLIGQLWTAYMGTLFMAKDVAMMLALLKVGLLTKSSVASHFSLHIVKKDTVLASFCVFNHPFQVQGHGGQEAVVLRCL